jgi:hypothetical protein
MKIRIRRPRHATVVAYLALVTALGGSAYAASRVGTSELKPNAVTSPKIRSGAVRASDVKAFAVRSESEDVPAGSPSAFVDVTAACRKHERLVSGGGRWATAGSGNLPTLINSAPAGDGWIVAGAPTASANTLTAFAICMRQ